MLELTRTAVVADVASADETQVPATESEYEYMPTNPTKQQKSFPSTPWYRDQVVSAHVPELSADPRQSEADIA
jgi:hypothetical protein